MSSPIPIQTKGQGMPAPWSWPIALGCLALALATGCAVYEPALFCQQDADCEPPYLSCDPETLRCSRDELTDCVDNVMTICVDGDLYWQDSCGQVGQLREECDCGCTGHVNCDPCDCRDNTDCFYLGANAYCDPFTHSCNCAASCEGACCGDDGCGGRCPDLCPDGTHCNADCVCVGHCEPASCEWIGAECGRLPDGCGGWIECGPEKDCQGPLAVVCEDGHWLVEIDCAALGQSCSQGACVAPSLCPDGLSCGETADWGLLGCLLPDGSLPPDSQTGCGAIGCEGLGNYCHFMGWDTACIQECGTCPDDQLCMDVTGNFFVCLVQEADGNVHVPDDAPTGCWDIDDCPGNRLCWCLDADCADTVCLENCSPPY